MANKKRRCTTQEVLEYKVLEGAAAVDMATPLKGITLHKYQFIAWIVSG